MPHSFRSMMKAEEAGSKRPSILRSGKSAPTPRPSSVKFNESVLARTESGDVLMVQLHAVAACNILDNAQWNSDDDYDVFLDSGKDQPASPLLPGAAVPPSVTCTGTVTDCANR